MINIPRISNGGDKQLFFDKVKEALDVLLGNAKNSDNSRAMLAGDLQTFWDDNSGDLLTEASGGASEIAAASFSDGADYGGLVETPDFSGEVEPEISIDLAETISPGFFNYGVL